MNTRLLSTIDDRIFNGNSKITNPPVFSGFIKTIIMMKKITLLSMLMLFTVTGMMAQVDGPVTHIDKVVVTDPLPTSVSVPVIVTDFNNVGSFSLTIDYDATIMDYSSVTFDPIVFPGLSYPVSPNPTPGRISVGWFGPEIASLPDSTVIFTINFVNYNGGTSLLTFYDPPASPEMCEYSDASAVVYNDLPYEDFYKNGFVTDLQATAVYTDACTPPYNVGEITITATGGSGEYQFSIDGGITWHNNPSYTSPYTFSNLTPGPYEVMVGDVLLSAPLAQISIGIVATPVHNVTQNLYYCYIQDAVDDANPGDHIVVDPGTYTENVIVDKELQITGDVASPADVIIDGDATGSVVTIVADNVIIEGFTIQNSEIGEYAGVAIAGASNCLIENNIVADNSFGIVILATATNANGNIIRNNIVENNVIITTGPVVQDSYGIFIDKMTGFTGDAIGNTIEDNYISGSKNGIYLGEAATQTDVIGNYVFENYHFGIHLYKSDNNTFDGNYIYNNGIVGTLLPSQPAPGDPSYQAAVNAAGVRIGGSQNNTFINNEVYNETATGGLQVKGFRLFDSDDRAPIGNVINDNKIYGHNEGSSPFLYGVDNRGYQTLTPVPVDATENYWGDPTGPYHPIYNTCGLANEVSDDVLFQPWYTTDAMITTATLPIYNVDKSTYYCEIQDAVDDADDGDEIHFLAAGNFEELIFNYNIEITIVNVSGGTVTLEGPGSALVVTDGDLFIDGVDFTTDADMPTIDLSNGKLTIRNCNVYESTMFDQTGILVSGGELDAGNSTEPGHNRILADGIGLSIDNTGGVVNALSNHWGSNYYMDIFPKISGNVPFDPWCNYDFTICYLSRFNGPVTYAPEKITTAGTVQIPITVDHFANVDAISLTLMFDPAILVYDNAFTPNAALSGNMSVIADNTNGYVRVGWFDPPVAYLPDGDIVAILQFDYFGGTSLLEWADTVSTLCEYQNALIQYPYIDTPQADFYIDGWITDLDAVSVTYTNVVCKGTASGTITVNGASGASGNYEYSVDGGFTWQASNIFYVPFGTYHVMIRDADFPQVYKTLDDNVEIFEPAVDLTATANWTKRVRCKGESNGQATVYPDGGWGGYTYLWSDPAGQTTPVAVGLAAGMYTVTVTDLGGCEVVATAYVIEPNNAFVANAFESKVVTCYGGNDGELTVSAQHGWGYYMYSIDNINYYNYLTSNVLGGLTAGNYTVHIFDDEGCEFYLPVTITEPSAPLTVTAVESEAVSCHGYSDGEVTVTATDGWGSYEYSIDGGVTWQTSNVFDNLTAGNYTVEVKDLHGCVETDNVTVTQPDLLTADISGDNEICFGFSTDIQIDFTGGTQPWEVTYTDGTNNYNVPNITTTPLVISVSPNVTTTYTIVSATDDNGCTGVIGGSATVTVNPLPEVGFTFKSLAGTGDIFEYCYDETVEVTLSHIWAGTAPFDIEWTVDDGTTVTTYTETDVDLVDNELFSGILAPGTYVVQITSIVDYNGCEPSDYTPYTATAIVHPEPAVGFTFQSLAGTGDTFEYCYDEIVEVTLSHIWSGDAPFDIEWTVDDGTTVTAYSETDVDLVDNELFSGILAPGTYVVQITSIVDYNGCEPSDYAPYTATAIVHPEPAVGFTFQSLAGTGDIFNYCYDETVEVTLSHIWSGDAPFDIEWTVDDGTTVTTYSETDVVLVDNELFSGILAPGTYVVQITSIVDANGCEPSDYAPYTATAIVHPEPAVGFTFQSLAGTGDTFEYCYDETVEVTLSHIWSGDAPFDIEWTVDDGTTVTAYTETDVDLVDNELFSSILAPGTYVVQITSIIDANGCEPSDYAPYTATAIVHPEPAVGFTFQSLAGTGDIFNYCYDETVEVTLSHIWSGDAPFDIEWTVDDGTTVTTYTETDVDLVDNELFSGILAPGTYVVQITSIIDANGCEPSDYAPYTATAIVHPEPAVGFTFQSLAGTGDTFEYCYDETVEVTLSHIWSGDAPFYIEWTVDDGTTVTTDNATDVDLVDNELFSGILAPGIYVVQITSIVDANGCEPSDYAPYTATAIVHEEPALGFSFNGDLAGTGTVFDFCYIDPVTVTLSDIWGGTAPFDIEWTVDDGTTVTAYTETDVDLVNNELFSSILAPGTYVVQITSIVDENGCEPSDYAPYTATVNVHSYSISGYYNYPNIYWTPLNNISVELQHQTNSSYVFNATTDPNGYYLFPEVCPGTYDVVSTTVKAPGGINATDAVQVNSWMENYPIEMARFISGDINLDGQVDGFDASAILEHFVTSGNPTFVTWPSDWTFWNYSDIVTAQVSTAPGFVYDLPTINVVDANVIQDFIGYAVGDFNASFVPGTAKSAGSITLNNNSSVQADINNAFELPVTADIDMNVSAISLILNYPADKVEVVDVYLTDDQNLPVLFYAQNGELRIGWNSLMPVMVNTDETLLTLKLRTLEAYTSGESVTFTLAYNELNEIAGHDYDVISNAEINISTIEGVINVPETFASDKLQFGNYPNPFTHSTTFEYTLPVEGKVTVKVYDMVGRVVNMPVNATQSAGKHTISIDNGLMGAGVYTANITLTTADGILSKSIRIVSQK